MNLIQSEGVELRTPTLRSLAFVCLPSKRLAQAKLRNRYLVRKLVCAMFELEGKILFYRQVTVLRTAWLTPKQLSNHGVDVLRPAASADGIQYSTADGVQAAWAKRSTSLCAAYTQNYQSPCGSLRNQYLLTFAYRGLSSFVV